MARHQLTGAVLSAMQAANSGGGSRSGSKQVATSKQLTPEEWKFNYVLTQLQLFDVGPSMVAAGVGWAGLQAMEVLHFDAWVGEKDEVKVAVKARLTKAKK